jgi:hypothetical protein
MRKLVVVCCSLVAFLSGLPGFGQVSSSVASSSNPAFVSQPVLLSASISVPAGVSAAPTGSVTFLDGSSALGTVPVVEGAAALQAQFASAGNHQITASYSGDSVFSAATSAPFVEVVTAEDGFGLSVTPVQASVKAGSEITGNVMVFGSGSANQVLPVGLSCEGLPAGAKCTFGTASLIPGASGAGTTVVISTTAQGSAVASASWLGVVCCLCLLGYAMVGFSRAGLVNLLLLSVGLVGCGTTTKFVPGPTPSGKYSVQVVGTQGSATGTSLTRTSTVQLTVN